MKQATKKQFWDIYINAVGTKKRQRTKKNHSFPILDLEQSNDIPPNLEEYLEKARQVLASEMRETSRAILCANPYLVSLEPGFVTREQRIFDPRNLRLEVSL